MDLLSSQFPYLTKERKSSYERNYLDNDIGLEEYLIIPPQKHYGYYCNYYVSRTHVENSFFDRLFNNERKDSWSVGIYLGDKYNELLNKKLIRNLVYFTEDSVVNALSSHPLLSEVVVKGVKAQYGIGFSDILYKGCKITGHDDHFYIFLGDIGDSLPKEKEEETFFILRNFADELIYDLNHLNFKASVLKQKEKSKNSEAPQWLRMCVIAGAKVCVRMIGAELDIAWGDTNSDGLNLDIPDSTDFDMSGLDGYLDIDLDSSPNSDNNYNINFMGKDTLPPNANSDGYIPDGSITLTRTTSDLKEVFRHFRKDGHDYVLYNGSYFRVDGSGTVSIGGISYDKT